MFSFFQTEGSFDLNSHRSLSFIILCGILKVRPEGRSGFMNRQKEQSRRTIEDTLNRLYLKKSSAPKAGYWVLLLIYLVTSAATSATASSGADVKFAGFIVPAYIFAGVLSSLANICIILMAVFYEKLGLITSLVLIGLQLPMIISGIVMRNNITSLPGVFGDVLAIIAVLFIYFNKKKMSDYEKVLRSQAVTDILTGLPNWFACTELIDELVRREERFAVVTIDINGFKSINDTMGFEAGNRVLIEISSKWKTIADSGETGTMDFIARLNGDQFSLVVRKFDSEDEIIHTIRRYESAMNEQINNIGYDFYISASFGYAFYPDDATDMDSVISYSDMAMHEIKSEGSDEHILRFTQEMLKNDHTLEFEGKIRAAIDNDGVFFMLQPQFDMSHKLRGFEALARMRDEDGSIISPGLFIPVAEKVGLVDKIDFIVFKKSAAFVGNLIRQYDLDITLSINVSVRHLMKKGFLEEMRRHLEESGFPANQLEVEITESVMIESLEKATGYIDVLREMGVQIAIDDFGTGYSSLSYLNSIPANLLKIDKSFIDGINSSEKAKLYIAAIISLGHIMGYEVISEGVEENDQLETLREIGCDYIQGYIWGKPLPMEDVEKLVSEG